MARLYLSKRINIIGGVLCLLMLRASYWQWGRHLEKQSFIRELNSRLEEPIDDLTSVSPSNSPRWEDLIHRRFKLQGEFDYAHEMVLRNRRFESDPGVHVLTPFRITGTELHVLVDRGFIPLSASEPESRKQFQLPLGNVELIGLLKETETKRFLAPSDPEAGKELPWVDAWLRVDVERISKQLSYPLLPIYFEKMGDPDPRAAAGKIVTEHSDRDEMLFAPKGGSVISMGGIKPGVSYPIPDYSTVIPAGRHLGYVFEWAAMALITALICLVLQLRPRLT